MNMDDLNLGTETVSALLALALKVELNDKTRFRATRSLDELVALLQAAQRIHHDDIRAALRKVFASLNGEQEALFRRLGIDVQPRTEHSMSYRGKHVTRETATGRRDGAPHDDKQGKTRIIYRGQEKWI